MLMFHRSVYANGNLCACGRVIVVRLNGRYRKPCDRDHDLCMRCYGAEMDRAAAVLLAGQERLGAECEAVLFDNLWDLYAR